MKRKTIKRGVSLVTAAALFTGLFGGVDQLFVRKVEASEAVTYLPAKAGVNLLPNATELLTSNNFMSNYVYKTDGFNITSEFKAQSWQNLKGSISSNEALSQARKYWHNGNEHWQAEFQYDFSGNSVLTELVQGNQIDEGYKAYLISDYHKHIGRHSDKKWDVAKLRLNRDITVTAEKKNDEQPQLVEGVLDVPSTWTSLRWEMNHQGCNCGSSAVSNSIAWLIDTTQPVVKRVYAAKDEKGNIEIENNSGFVAGDMAYMVLEFSENIRFADNTTDDLTLNMDLYGTMDDQQITDAKLTAKLVRLEGKKLVFQFAVPQQLNGKDINAYIRYISGSQDWVGQSGKPFSYVLLNKNGKKYTINNTTIQNDMKCSSKITDLAGNPVNWSDSKKKITTASGSVQKVYLDSTAPELNKVVMTGSMISEDSTTDKDSWPADIDRSSVFAGIGDKISYSCYFTEALKISDEGQVKAVLNIKDKDGNPIELALKNNEIKSGKEVLGKDAAGETISILNFETLTIAEGMEPVTKDGESIQIVSLEGLSGATDLRGNALGDVSNLTKKAAQQIYLDVDAPVAQVSLAKDSEGIYTPNSTGGFTFTIPISVSDGDNEAYSSGTAGKNGKFRLVMDDKYSYMWYIDQEPSIKEDAYWKNGWTGTDKDSYYANSFVQMEQQQYIHFKLKDNVDYGYNGSHYFQARMDVYTEDYAGNTQTQSYKLKHDVDNVGPELELIDQKSKLNTDGTGTLTLTFRVSDQFGIGDKLIYNYGETSKEVSLTKGSKEETVTVEIPLSATDVTNQKKEVTAKVTDVKGNQTERTTVCTYKLKTISSDYSIGNKGSVENPLLKKDLDITIKQPETINLGEKDEKTRTMLLIPLGKETIDGKEQDTYLAFITPIRYPNETVAVQNIFQGLSNANGAQYPYNYHCWYKLAGTVSKDGSNGQLEEVVEYSNSNNNFNSLGTELEKVYGKIEVLFVTSTEFVANENFNFGNVDSQRILTEKETMYFAITSEYSVEFIDMVNAQGESVKDNLYVEKKGTDETGTTEIYKAVSCHSLADIYAKIKITNEKEKDGLLFGYNQINLEESYYSLFGINTEEFYSYTGKLDAAGEQLLSFPDDIKWTGIYELTVYIKTKEMIETGNNFTVLSQYIYVDRLDYGVSPCYYSKVYADKELEKTSPDEADISVFEQEKRVTDQDVIQVGLADMPSDQYTTNPAESSVAYNRLTFIRTVNYCEDVNDSRYTVKRNWKIRAWSAMDPDGEKNARWYDMPAARFNFQLMKTEEFTEADYSLTGIDGTEVPVLPLMAGDNVVYYEIQMNEHEPVRSSKVIQVLTQAPEVSVSEISHTANKVILNVDVPADILTNGGRIGTRTSSDEHVRMYQVEQYYLQPEYYEPTKSLFFVADSYGNLTITEEYSVTDVDGIVPRSNYEKYYDTDANGFHFKYYAYDNEGIEPDSMEAVASPAYSALLLGMTEKEWEAAGLEQIRFKVPVNTQGDGIWESYEESYYGIYKTKIENNYTDEETGWKGYSVEVWGEYPYIAGEYEGSYYPYGLEFYVTDVNGNDSYNSYYSYRSEKEDNEAPVIEVSSLTEDGYPVVTSNIPLKSVTGYGAGKMSMMSITDGDKEKITFGTTLPMICVDGNYELSYMDLFGNEYTQTVPVTVFKNEDIDVHYSETALTNQKVSVSVKAVNPGDAITEITAVSGDTEVKGTIDKMDAAKASITLEQNGKITIKTLLGRTHTLRVSNIDTELEEAQIVFTYNGTPEPVYSEEDADTIQTEATAIVTCTEDIDGVNGKLSYTFPYGSKKGDSYTFQYRDEAGNTGEITAVLPYNIEKKAEEKPEIDETAPEYEMVLLGMRNASYQYLADFYTGDKGDNVSAVTAQYPAQQYEVKVRITDDSDTKMIIRKPESAEVTAFEDASDEIDGIIVSGTTLTIKGNAAFTIYLIDSYNNVTKIDGFAINSIDRTAPKVNPVYEPITTSQGYEGVRVWFDAENDEEIIALDAGIPAVQKTLENGTTILSYYKDYEKNMTDTFHYKDIYGNIASVNVEVQALDTEYPVVTSTLWFGIGNADTPEQAAGTFSNDVTAQVKCNKVVSQVKFYEYDEQAAGKKGAEISENLPVSAGFNGMNVTISYSANVDRKLIAEITASGNGRKVLAELPAVTCIDKTAPVVTMTSQLSGTKTEMTYTFTTDEPVIFSENATSSVFAKEHSWTVSANGPYVLKFTDAAGNIAEYPVNVTEIDDVPLTLQYSQSEDGSNAKENPEEMNLQMGQIIYVQANKQAQISISGRTTNVAAGQWTKVTLNAENGIHILKAVDMVTKKEVYANLLIQAKDTMAPIIGFDNSVVSLDESVSLEEMKEAVDQGVVVNDNRDGILNNYSITGLPAAVTPGYYTLTYTAQDSSGNIGSANRTLYIAYQNEPDIVINGQKAVPYSMIITDQDTILTEVSAMAERGLMIKWKKGIKTTGQMKYSTSVLGNGESFKAEEPGYYTVYVRTGNRHEYIFYVYADYSLNVQGGIE